MIRSSFRLLIDAEGVSTWITKSGCDFRRIHSYLLHNYSTICDNRLNRRGCVIHHDVNQQAWSWRRSAVSDPCSAYLTNSVIKGQGSITTFPDSPTEYTIVKIG